MDTPTAPAPAAQAPAPEPAEVKPPSFKNEVRWLIPILVVCALGALFWPKGSGKVAPGGKVEDRDGGRVELEDQYRKVTLVHFWATWCLPCRDEMPKLQRLAGELAARPDFALLMVAVADDRKKVAAFLAEAKAGSAPPATYFDEGWSVSKSWGSNQLPETHLLVDGKWIHSFIGAQDWDDPAVRARVQDALAGKTKGS